ncbi:MerR family transcriptional regulator [Actinomycetospora lutea]|uniref:MerR family transcriptional regulator n=1 Tax=Actinomycetospora lutea TaxID=663604 RepID=UPI00236500EF|nr:MerR family transcriptional regulator [Actinomycetospora lutea]MDD7940134.1 MerR family transcriptional regulator [Actinomycetospora lutea]
MTVSELARRSGVPATTVRFYDAEGVLPARRSPSGYRLYDGAALERLRFIGTAKSLGLALPEIRRLLEPWQHGRCSDVRGELGPLLDRRIVEIDARIDELRAFGARLARARGQLAALTRDGPCDPSCADLGRRSTDPALAALRREPAGRAPGAVPVIACTLDGVERLDRVDRWRAVLGDVAGREAIDGGVRLTFDPDRVRIGELAELATAEAGCCAFFALTLHLGATPILEVRAPAEALVLVHELFGVPDA